MVVEIYYFLLSIDVVTEFLIFLMYLFVLQLTVSYNPHFLKILRSEALCLDLGIRSIAHHV